MLDSISLKLVSLQDWRRNHNYTYRPCTCSFSTGPELLFYQFIDSSVYLYHYFNVMISLSTSPFSSFSITSPPSMIPCT